MPLGVVEVGRHGDDSMGDLLSEKCLGSLLHIGEHHGGDLLCGECLLTLAGLNLDMGLGVLVNQLEGEELDVRLHSLIGELTADETLGVKDCVLRVGGQLVLGGVTHQPLTIGSEGDIAGSDTVALVVGNDLNTSVLENSNTETNRLQGSTVK